MAGKFDPPYLHKLKAAVKLLFFVSNLRGVFLFHLEGQEPDQKDGG